MTYHLWPLKAHIHKLRNARLTQPRHLRIRHLLCATSASHPALLLMHRCLCVRLRPVLGCTYESSAVGIVVLGDFGILWIFGHGFVEEGLE